MANGNQSIFDLISSPGEPSTPFSEEDKLRQQLLQEMSEPEFQALQSAISQGVVSQEDLSRASQPGGRDGERGLLTDRDMQLLQALTQELLPVLQKGAEAQAREELDETIEEGKKAQKVKKAMDSIQDLQSITEEPFP